MLTTVISFAFTLSWLLNNISHSFPSDVEKRSTSSAILRLDAFLFSCHFFKLFPANTAAPCWTKERTADRPAWYLFWSGKRHSLCLSRLYPPDVCTAVVVNSRKLAWFRRIVGISISAECLILSNAFLKSIVLMYSGTLHSRQRCSKILYTVRWSSHRWLGLKPAWLGGCILCRKGASWANKTVANSL